jgi:hypothetical protein
MVKRLVNRMFLIDKLLDKESNKKNVQILIGDFLI